MSDEELAAAAGAPVEQPRARSAGRGRSSRRARSPDSSRRRARSQCRRTRLRRSSASSSCVRAQPATLDEPGARAIVRELKAVGGDLRALRLALTGERARAGALDGLRRAAGRRGARAGAASPDVAADAGVVARTAVYDRRMRLQDTLTREARRASAASRADRDLRLRPDRLPAGAHRQRAAVRRLHVARAVAQDAGSRGPARPQHHGRQRQDLRGGARAQRRAGARGDRVVPRGHRGLRARDAGLAAARDRDDAGDRRADRGAARLGARVHGRTATSTSASRASRATAPCRVSVPTRSRSRSRTRPRRTRATSPSGRRRRRARTRRGRPPGASAAPAGTSSARRWPRRSSARSSGSTAAGSTSSSRITRTSARSRCPSAIRSRGSGCTTGCSRFTGEKMSKSLGNVETIRDVLDTWGAETALVFFLTAHWRKPIDFSEETMAAARAQWRGLAEIVIDHSRPPRSESSWEELVDVLEDDFNTPEALAVFHRWHALGDADLLTRGLDVFGLPRPARLHKIHLTDHVTVSGDVSVEVVEGHRPNTREILEGRPGLVELFRRRRAARRRTLPCDGAVGNPAAEREPLAVRRHFRCRHPAARGLDLLVLFAARNRGDLAGLEIDPADLGLAGERVDPTAESRQRSSH